MIKPPITEHGATAEHAKTAALLATNPFGGQHFTNQKWERTLGLRYHPGDHIANGVNKGRCAHCSDSETPLVVKHGWNDYTRWEDTP